MALRAEHLTEVAELLSTSATPPIAELRQRFPSLTVTRCDASDVTETPYFTCGFYDVHLLDGRDHCITLTYDLAAATGLVLARRTVPT